MNKYFAVTLFILLALTGCGGSNPQQDSLPPEIGSLNSDCTKPSQSMTHQELVIFGYRSLRDCSLDDQTFQNELASSP